MSNIAKQLADLYRRHKVTKEGLLKAVKDKVITEQEYIQIVGVGSEQNTN